MASKDVIALANRIRAEFGIPVDPEKFFRTYAGRVQKKAGAFTWIMYTEKGNRLVGGYEPIRKYITKKNILEISEESFCQYEMDVYTPQEYGRVK